VEDAASWGFTLGRGSEGRWWAELHRSKPQAPVSARFWYKLTKSSKLTRKWN